MWYWWCQIKARGRENTGKTMVFKGKRTSGHHHQWYRRMLVFTKQKNHFAYQRNLLWVVSGKQAWRKWQVPSCQEAWRVYTYLIDLQQGDWDLPVDLKDLRNISPRCMSLSHSFLLTMPKPLTVWITINCGKFWKRWEYQTTWSASWQICLQVRKQQLELDMEQKTGSK